MSLDARAHDFTGTVDVSQRTDSYCQCLAIVFYIFIIRPPKLASQACSRTRQWFQAAVNRAESVQGSYAQTEHSAKRTLVFPFSDITKKGHNFV